MTPPWTSRFSKPPPVAAAGTRALRQDASHDERQSPEVGRLRRPVLELPTLVLNRNWQPVNVTTVARALVLVWNDAAEVVDPQSYQTFDWPSWSEREVSDLAPALRAGSGRRIAVPEIVTLIRYSRIPKVTVTFSRRNLLFRDNWTCQYCGKQPGAGQLTIDHVVPRSLGGPSSWTNCVLACEPCNSRKAARTPSQAGMRLRSRPTSPQWGPDFARHDGGLPSWHPFVKEIAAG